MNPQNKISADSSRSSEQSSELSKTTNQPFSEPSQRAKIDYIACHLGKPLSYFKSKADVLFKLVKQQDLVVSDSLKMRLSDAGYERRLENIADFKRKDALNLIASEYQFESWNHLKHWVEKINRIDFSDFFGQPKFLGFTNVWFNNYGDAKQHQIENGGVLLSYRIQFFITTPFFLERLGFEKDDPEWKAMEFDWVNPKSPQAKLNVIETLLNQLQ